MSTDEGRPQYSDHLSCKIVPIADDLFCVWGYDLEERNLRFINGIDDEYFVFLNSLYEPLLDGPDAQRAALAIRSNYYLSLETFFSLLLSTLQCVDCTVGWITRIKNTELRLLVSQLLNQNFPHYVCWRNFSESSGFDGISTIIFSRTVWASDKNDKTIENFSKIWQRFAYEFLDTYTINEYNSIKHGFRARAGGFYLSFGEETEPGKQAPPENMKSIGGSRYGSSFFTLENIVDSNKTMRHHVRIRSNNINWIPQSMIQKTELISLSINNIKSFLKIMHGQKPSECAFTRLCDENAYTNAWEKVPSITSMNLDFHITEDLIVPHSKDGLKDFLKKSREDDRDTDP